MKKNDQKLIITAGQGDFMIIYVDYISGRTANQFAEELAPWEQVLGNVVEPTVVITQDKVPPIWVVPMVQGLLKNASMVAVDRRDCAKESCTVVFSEVNNAIKVGNSIKNPDPDPAWHVKRTSSARR